MKVRMRMKRLLLLGCLFASFTSMAWAQKVTLNFKNEKIENVLSSIKTQTKLGLVFSDQLIDVNQLVSINLKDTPLEEALTELLASSKITFEVRNKKIYFIEKKYLKAVKQAKRK